MRRQSPNRRGEGVLFLLQISLYPAGVHAPAPLLLGAQHVRLKAAEGTRHIAVRPGGDSVVADLPSLAQSGWIGAAFYQAQVVLGLALLQGDQFEVRAGTRKQRR